MRKMIVLFFLIFSLYAVAQKEKTEAYIAAYKELAIAEMLRSGVPASITLAQGILESQSGESVLSKKSNNHFGIKCKTEWTGPTTYHDDDEKGECFRVYTTVEESYKDHSDFLKTRPHYAFLFNLDPTDYDGWAKGLKKAGYATSSTYPQKLLKVIIDYQLQKYSLQALHKQNNTDSTTNNIEIIINKENKLTEKEKTELVTELSEKQTIQVSSKVSNNFSQITSMPTLQTTAYPIGIFSINQSKVIFEKAGKSLLSMANQYDISLSKLLEYNDLTEMNILEKDQLIFLEKKLKKGNKEFHMVAIGENLHSISQIEGIRYESLLEYNSLKKGATISIGYKVWLHTPTTVSLKPNKKTI